MITRQDPDLLTTTELSRYRSALEAAIAELPELSPERQVYAGRLAQVTTEEETRSAVTGLAFRPRGTR